MPFYYFHYCLPALKQIKFTKCIFAEDYYILLMCNIVFILYKIVSFFVQITHSALQHLFNAKNIMILVLPEVYISGSPHLSQSSAFKHTKKLRHYLTELY